MPRSLSLYLLDIQKAADWILTFTEGLDQASYNTNRLVQAAVERQFIIIGEALAQMRQHHPNVMQQLEESRQIVAFRNVLVHQYSSVDNDDVWSAIRSKLPEFREQVVAVIASVNDGKIS